LRVNGQPFHYFLLNLIQTSKRASLRVWNKEKTEEELQAYLKVELPPPPPPKIRKEPLSQSKLSEIALLLDTGGIYSPEDWQ
jgi:hypothetical protein